MRLTASSIGRPTWWRWDFGDGTSSTGQDPSHTFNPPSPKIETLTAGTDKGNNTLSQTLAKRSVSSFSWDPPNPYVTEVMQLEVYPIPLDARFKRQVDDGNAVTGAYLRHAFATAGDHQVFLTTSFIGWSETTIRTYTVTAGGTMGQGIPAVTVDAASRSTQGATLVQLTESDRFRTNLGIVNPVSEPIRVEVEARVASGASLGAESWTVPPFGLVQVYRFLERFACDPVDDAFATVSSPAGTGFVAYAWWWTTPPGTRRSSRRGGCPEPVGVGACARRGRWTTVESERTTVVGRWVSAMMKR